MKYLSSTSIKKAEHWLNQCPLLSEDEKTLILSSINKLSDPNEELKDNQCRCFSCGKIFTFEDDKPDGIFRLEKNPKSGLCFNCY